MCGFHILLWSLRRHLEWEQMLSCLVVHFVFRLINICFLFEDVYCWSVAYLQITQRILHLNGFYWMFLYWSGWCHVYISKHESGWTDDQQFCWLWTFECVSPPALQCSTLNLIPEVILLYYVSWQKCDTRNRTQNPHLGLTVVAKEVIYKKGLNTFQMFTVTLHFCQYSAIIYYFLF